jgi:hypothetical protein
MTAALRDLALSIGADPRDTADERFRKRLLVGVALVILPIGFLWGCLYWGVGEHAVALTPWAYVTDRRSASPSSRGRGTSHSCGRRSCF